MYGYLRLILPETMAVLVCSLVFAGVFLGIILCSAAPPALFQYLRL